MGVVVALALLAIALAIGEDKVSGEEPDWSSVPTTIIHGPYLQNLTSSSVTICWTTNVSVSGSVSLGERRDVLSVTTTSPTPTRRHEETLSDLDENTLYWYRVESGDAVSPEASFRTASSKDRPFTFAVYGDTQTDHVTHSTVLSLIDGYDPAFFVHCGDLVESGLALPDWYAFWDIVSPYANDTPLWPVVGNHDLPADIYLDMFALPGNEHWYSFDYEGSHFIAIDSTQDLRPGSVQHRWLVEDLDRNDGMSRWTFVYLHYPPYSSGEHGSNLTIREALDPLLELYSVTAVFSGHEHSYEHAEPGNGVHYFVTGGGGGHLYPVGTSSFTTYSESSHHFLLVEVREDTVTVTAVRLDGSVLEAVEIDNPQHAGEPVSEDGDGPSMWPLLAVVMLVVITGVVAELVVRFRSGR